MRGWVGTIWAGLKGWTGQGGALRAAGCIAVAAGALAVAACTSAGPVVSSDGAPDRLMVTVAASGTRMAWAHAYTTAVSQAQHYCADRGENALIQMGGADGVGGGDTQRATVRFKCSRI